MRDLLAIIERLKVKFDLKNDTQVAKLLNVEQNTLSSWKKRNKIPYENLDKLCYEHDISMDWVLCGELDVSTSRELLENFQALSKEKKEIYLLRIKADALESKTSL